MEASKESTLVMLTKRILELEKENSLLRVKVIESKMRDGCQDKLKLLVQRREVALAKVKAEHDEKKNKKQTSPMDWTNDVTCDCGQCDEGFDEVDTGMITN